MKESIFKTKASHSAFLKKYFEAWMQFRDFKKFKSS